MRENGKMRIAVDTDASPSGTGGSAASRPIDSHAQRPAGKMRIAVDFDGVLFDHVPYVLRGFRDAHGIDLEEEGMRYWDFFQYRAVREKNLTWQCVSTVLRAIDTDAALHTLPPRDPHDRAVGQPDVVLVVRHAHRVRRARASHDVLQVPDAARLRRFVELHDEAAACDGVRLEDRPVGRRVRDAVRSGPEGDDGVHEGEP